jgi:hypothetical protein
MTKFPGSECFWSLEVAPAVGLISIAGIALLLLSTFTPRSAARRAGNGAAGCGRRVRERLVIAALQAPSCQRLVSAGSAAYLGSLKASGIAESPATRAYSPTPNVSEGDLHVSHNDEVDRSQQLTWSRGTTLRCPVSNSLSGWRIRGAISPLCAGVGRPDEQHR